MNLKFINEDSLCYIIKHSVAIAVILDCSLVVDVMMLMQEVVDDDVEIEENLLNIKDSSVFYMLFTDWHDLLKKW